MKLVDCFEELKIHGLVEYSGEEKPVLTKKAVQLIEEAWLAMRENYPEATEEDVTIRALIVIILERRGLVYRKNLHDYINALKSLAQKYPA